ncbi:MAG: hypothetical protein IPO07_31400 [Haliscomenobacter sp.]|nr:hypothetical protein [Haliscomenobacter sp.]MBK9492783.1 hypothetical protein [Haliscomenobacter sp.]
MPKNCTGPGPKVRQLIPDCDPQDLTTTTEPGGISSAFSRPLWTCPPPTNWLGFYRRLLELNDEKIGIKFRHFAQCNKVWATLSGTSKGIDFNELTTFISDLNHWRIRWTTN